MLNLSSLTHSTASADQSLISDFDHPALNHRLFVLEVEPRADCSDTTRSLLAFLSTLALSWLSSHRQRAIGLNSEGIEIFKFLFKPAIAAVHCPQSVFDIGHCAVIHCDAGGVSLVDQEKQRKIDIPLTDLLLDVSSDQ